MKIQIKATGTVDSRHGNHTIQILVDTDDNMVLAQSTGSSTEDAYEKLSKKFQLGLPFADISDFDQWNGGDRYVYYIKDLTSGSMLYVDRSYKEIDL